MAGSFQPVAEVGTQDKQVKHGVLLSQNVTQRSVSQQLKALCSEQLRNPSVIWALVNLLLAFHFF